MTEIRHGAGDRADRSTRGEAVSSSPEATADAAGEEGRAPVDARSRTWLTARGREIVHAAVSLVLLVLIFRYVFRQFADISEVWDAIRMLTWTDVAILVLATAWSLFTYWIVVVLATPGLTYPQAAVMTQSTTAVANSVPVGGAVAVGLTYAMFTSWGFSKARSTVSVVVTGIWNNFVKLAAPILALALLAFEGRPGEGRVAAAVAGLAGLVGAIVLLASSCAARFAPVGTVTGRWASAVLRFAAATRHGLGPCRGQVPPPGHRSGSAPWVADPGHAPEPRLALSRARRVLSWECLTTTSDGRRCWRLRRSVGTAIPLTPEGSVVELALIEGLTGGWQRPQVVVAVLLFRLLTYVLPSPSAWAHIVWRRNRSWLDSAPPCRGRSSPRPRAKPDRSRSEPGLPKAQCGFRRRKQPAAGPHRGSPAGPAFPCGPDERCERTGWRRRPAGSGSS